MQYCHLLQKLSYVTYCDTAYSTHYSWKAWQTIHKSCHTHIYCKHIHPYVSFGNQVQLTLKFLSCFPAIRPHMGALTHHVALQLVPCLHILSEKKKKKSMFFAFMCNSKPGAMLFKSIVTSLYSSVKKGKGNPENKIKQQ